MRLFADGNIWAVESNYAEKDAVKAAGFRWDPKEKRWWTNDRERAAKLVQFADDSCRAELAGVADAKTEALAASRAAASDAEFPAPDGLSYLPYQRAGISYALSRPGTLIGDDMGLGKTVQAIGVVNASPDVRAVLVICPASLKLNWKKEMTKWLVRPFTIGIANGSFPDTDIVIINYDILVKHHDAIRAREWDLLVADECHALKNPDAIRTQQVIGRKEKKKGKKPAPAISPISAKRRIFMSGTPICNRPAEIFPILSSLDPDGLGKSFFSFATRYCNGHQGRFGWDFSGASRLDELQEKLRTTCFPYNTMIYATTGPIPIGEVVENARNIEVYSFNMLSASVERRKVVAFSKRPAPNNLIRIEHEFGEFSCTPDHKIWTAAGYVRADALAAGVRLSILPESENNESAWGGDECQVLFREVRGCTSRKTGDIKTEGQCYKIGKTDRPIGKNMPRMWNRVYKARQQGGRGLRLECEEILQSTVFEQMEIPHFGNTQKLSRETSTFNRKSKDRCNQSWPKDERHGATRRAEEGIVHCSKEALGRDTYRRTAKAILAHFKTSKRIAQGFNVETGRIGSADRYCQTQWTIQKRRSIFCKRGFTSHGIKNGDRSRWPNASLSKTTGNGQEERKNIVWSRILRIEVLERGNRSELNGGGPEDQFVYCVEVEGNHNYFANGVLVSNCMVRRTKSQVLTELPPKRRQIIEMPANGATQQIEAEGRVWKLHEEALADLRARVELAKASDDPTVFEEAVKALTKAAAVAFDEISKCRHDVALAKVPHVVEHLRDAIESSGKVVLFCHHRDMVEAISAEFPGAAIIHGGIAKIEERQAAVERFQSDPCCQLFIGTIGAAGVGHTLTAASHVVFAELDWVPGLVTQAEDRCHRIGQTDTVLVQHLVLEGSLDAKMAQTLVNKQNVIDAALDKHHPARVEMEKLVVIPGAESATERTSRKQVEEEAVHLTPAQVGAIHQGLRMLAAMDADFAQSQNMMGFSKIDVRIGHSLAEAAFLSPRQAILGKRIVTKYRRQLPADLLEAINGREAA